MSNDQLTKELISDPRLWRLSMELKPDALEVVIHSTVEDNSLIHRRINLKQSDGENQLKQLEEAIYDNPLLLGDFSKTDFVISTKRFTLVPDEVTDEDTREEIMATLWPEGGYTILDNKLSTSGSTLLMGVDTPLLAFIRRTFPIVHISHQLTPIITYFYNKERLNNASKMYVHLRHNSVDIIYFSNGKLEVANTFGAATADDMLYFIMMAVKASGFDMKNDEMMLCGLPALREQLSPTLRKYITYVMPVVFPSAMFNVGKDALESPFELIILPLCE